ncbi:hypothetical protein RM531_14135 [Salinisphaera sp. P385]|uniref:Uncharacterized protein n=1 Tax=Spectribacter acetivorans TaxID=3075603 RepID=A0ABU3BAZ0_9GAMM|nr:hypothetical protein [Salinisphaera sp. P385]MDT0619613.1 hypothetical protein [Salinisphaera sp. P385]
MVWLKSFIAGFAATLICHQGLYTLFWLGGAVPNPPFAMAPTWPFGVPAVISLAFWGGLWGLPVWWFIRDAVGRLYWLRALILGALGPSAVALFLVFPLKGMGVAGGWDPTLIMGALMLNGAWGLGVAWGMRWAGEARTI